MLTRLQRYVTKWSSNQSCVKLFNLRENSSINLIAQLADNQSDNLIADPSSVSFSVIMKQEVAELCQAQPVKHKLFGSNGAIFWGVWIVDGCIVELLNCWIVELLICWIVVWLNCWSVELLNFWIVELLNCWIVELLYYWIIEIWNC